MTGGEYLALLERSPKLAHEKLFGEYYNYVRTIAFNRLRSTGTTEDIEECISDIFAQIFFTFGEKYSNGDMKGFVGINSSLLGCGCPLLQKACEKGRKDLLHGRGRSSRDKRGA